MAHMHAVYRRKCRRSDAQQAVSEGRPQSDNSGNAEGRSQSAGRHTTDPQSDLVSPLLTYRYSWRSRYLRRVAQALDQTQSVPKLILSSYRSIAGHLSRCNNPAAGTPMRTPRGSCCQILCLLLPSGFPMITWWLYTGWSNNLASIRSLGDDTFTHRKIEQLREPPDVYPRLPIHNRGRPSGASHSEMASTCKPPPISSRPYCPRGRGGVESRYRTSPDGWLYRERNFQAKASVRTVVLIAGGR